jgi:predicted DNA-binding WGR domain protein
VAPARAALAGNDRAALAAHLAALAELRGRTPVPKPGLTGQVVPVAGAATHPPRNVRADRPRIVPVLPDLGPVAAFRSFVRLASTNLEANRDRVYVLAWQPGLWGGAALVQRWGRAGRPLRSVATWYGSRVEADRAVTCTLRRRLRHGYRVVTWE